MTVNNEFKTELYERFSKISAHYNGKQRAFILEVFDDLTAEVEVKAKESATPSVIAGFKVEQ
jgi:hypothetical protein